MKITDCWGAVGYFFVLWLFQPTLLSIRRKNSLIMKKEEKPLENFLIHIRAVLQRRLMVYFTKVAKKGEKTPKNTPKKFFKKFLKICGDEKIPFFRILKFRPLKKVFEFSLKKIRIPPKLPVDLKTSFSKRSKKF